MFTLNLKCDEINNIKSISKLIRSKNKNNILYEQRAARDSNSSTHIHNLDEVFDTWCNNEDTSGCNGGALFQVRRKRSVWRDAVYDARTYIHRSDILYATIYIYIYIYITFI